MTRPIFNSFDYLMLSPTGLCNLSCKNCTRKGGGNYKLGVGIIKQHFPNIKQIKLQGLGEPFLNKDLSVLCRELKEAYPDVHILTITNGTLGYYYNSCLDVLRHIDELYISIDSLTNDVNKSKSDLYKSLSTLDSLVKSFDVDLYINTTLYDYNSNTENLVMLASMMGIFTNVKGLRIQHHQDWNDKSIINYIDDSKIDMSIFKHPKVQFVGRDDFDYKHCLWNTKRVQIDEEGNIKLCCLKTNQNIEHLNNILTYYDFNKRFEFATKNNLMPHPLCDTCSFRLLNDFNNKILKEIK